MIHHVLFATQGQFSADDSKSVRVFRFRVPSGVGALALSFDYTPRTSVDRSRNTELVERALEAHNEGCSHTRDLDAQRTEVANLYRELFNLLNVVLIDPAGKWRGRWDRNPASEDALLLGKNFSSKGFLPGAIDSGEWTAAIECHGVFGDPVRFELKIEARADVSPEEAAVSARSSTRARRSADRPGWYFGEMHSHTLHSDGRNEVFELAEKAAELGIDFVALTDHNTMTGLLELPEDERALPVTIVPGCELTTFHGHHPVYGISELVPWHEDGRVRGLEELAPIVRRAGGIVSVAHPFKMGDPICTGCRMPRGLDPRSFDLFEVWYRRWDAAESDNISAYELWNSYWSKGHRVTAVAARDWHGASQEKPFPGNFPFTGVWARDGSAAAILEGLRSGRVIMSGGPILDLQKNVVEIERLDGPAELRIFRSGEIVMKSRVENDQTIDLQTIFGTAGYYRAELWRGDEPRAITNHVVV
jgi:hypothetical protein